jgi:WD40 repeat protein
MSGSLKNIYSPTPATTRGKATSLSGDPKGVNFLYTTGNSVVIRNLKNPLLADIYYEHASATTVAKYAPSGFYIASGDVSGTMRIWDTTQLEHPLKIELKVLSGPITDIAWSSDNQRIIVVGDGKERFGAALLWDSGASVGEISGHSKAILSCDFKPTRPFRVITGGEDNQVNWFEGPPFKFNKAHKDHSRFVNSVRFSPDGNKVVSVGLDKKGIVYDGKTGDKLFEFAAEGAHTAGIYGASWSGDSTKILTVSADKTAKLWDAKSGALINTIKPGDDSTEHQQLGCLWQGDIIVTVNLNGDLTYIDAKAAAVSQVILGHNKFVTALAYDHHHKVFYTGSYDASIIQWDYASGSTKPLIGKGHTNSITSIRVQGDHLVTISMDDSIRFTPLASREYGAAIALDGPPAAVSVGTKTQDLAIVVTIKSVVVIRGGKIAQAKELPFQPTAVALSPNETEVIVGGKDNSLHVFTLSGDKLTEVTTLAGHRGALTVATYSPDGKFFATADANRDIFVWDAAARTIKIQGWVFHTARVNSLSWHPNSKYIASGALDSNVYVWSLDDPNKRVFIRGAHHGGVNDVAWVEDAVLATAGQDCTFKTWNIKF